MPGRRLLKLGTRASLLAVAQSQLVAAELARVHPDLDVRLVTMNTRGDRDRHTPLNQVDDPNFFSAELDQALLDGQVDFCVHSAKDLSVVRPAGIYRAATPRRENPRDVVLLRREVTDLLEQGTAIRIGSSSERRRFNVGDFLRDALPARGPVATLQFEPLRGAVERRVERIGGDPGRPDALDGVVLALAGLARLWRHAPGWAALEPVLSRARWMVLPLSRCPSAPGQGALVVECRRDDQDTRTLLAPLHDPVTQTQIEAEFHCVEALDPLCRSGFGVTSVTHPSLGNLLYTRGPSDAHSRVATQRLVWNEPPRPAEARPWDGGSWNQEVPRQPLPVDPACTRLDAVFAAHWHALTDRVPLPSDSRIWVSGPESWFRAATRGLWVEGCADNLGFAALADTLATEVLQLPSLSQWTVLTRSGAEPSWAGTGVERIVATYRAGQVSEPCAQLGESIRKATHFFWGSVEQFRAVQRWLPAHARHACGPGKTGPALRGAGIHSVDIFPSRREWQAWLR
ncbi:MAG: hydroxymethylbilane synthase [Gammaproteobacteria bacterium]|nr:hydroxymethylbilane synthase [Gammaproteobacteria bacterium]